MIPPFTRECLIAAFSSSYPNQINKHFPTIIGNVSYVPRRGRRPASSVSAAAAAAVVAVGGGHYSQSLPHHAVGMGLDVHHGVYQSQLMPGGQSENGLLPPPAHPQHMAPPHIEVAHPAGMMHLGGMPVSESPAYMDSSTTMMISPGPPPPVATMVTAPSHLSSQQSHDPESYAQHHHQQQQEIHLQQQLQHDDEHHQQQQLIMHVNTGSSIATTLSDEGTMTPPIPTPQHQVVIPQHILASGHESVTPEAVTPEPSTLDAHQRHIVVTPASIQESENDGTNVLGGSHASSPYQAPVDSAHIHPASVNTDQVVVNTEGVADVNQMTAAVATQQENGTVSVLPSDPLQQQQQPEAEMTSMTHSNITANHDIASSVLVEEQVTMVTEPGDNQSDIARLSTNTTD